MLHAECEIDNRIGVEVAQRDRARQGRTGQRRVDLGDLDRALGPPPDAIESHGHVRRIAELRVVDGVIRQHSQADRKSTRLNSSHMSISYAVFCLKKKKTK